MNKVRGVHQRNTTPSSSQMPSLLRLPSPHLTRAASTRLPREQRQQDPNKKKASMTANKECGGGGGGGSSSSGVWWRKALGQRLNVAGLTSFVSVATKDRHLAVPHLSVPDVRWVDWEALEEAGFRGVVFDKDNTITAPYNPSLWPPFEGAFKRCREVFDGRIAVLSNSAGLHEYDPDGSHARAIEDSIEGVHVVRHGTKKPAGGTEEIEKYFGCSAAHLVMVGDRYFTDVVYGNRNGFLTILVEPLSLAGEPLIVQQVRRCETYLVNCWRQDGVKPTKHGLLSGTQQLVRNPSL